MPKADIRQLHSITSSAIASNDGDRDTEPVCRLEVDDHLELGRLLDRDIGDFRAFEDKIDNLCATLPLRAVICPVGLVTASLLKQAVLCSNPQITL